MDNVSNILIHNMYELTLVDFLKSLKLKNIPPLMTYNISRTTNTYSYVPDEYRKLVRGLINFVSDIHKKNMSLFGV